MSRRKTKNSGRVYATPREPQQPKQFGYDVVESTGKRRRSSTNLRSEDRELISHRRKQLLAQARDLMRNFSVARWAVGKHLDFVTDFNFISKTRTSFDTQFQKLMEEWMNDPLRCDITGRHTFKRMLRMTEARSVLDGDHLLIRLGSGQLQQIESDRIRNGPLQCVDNVVHGCRQDKYGRTIGYQVHSRGPNGTGYQYQAEVPAAHAMFHAYFPSERADQVRGVGLMTTGINDLIDAYEWSDTAKLTEKARAVIAMIFQTQDSEGVEAGKYQRVGNGKYKVDFGSGPVILELEPGDSAQMLSSATPAGPTVQFFNGCIGFGLKALDLPLCFFDETLTNFFGQRAQFILYIKSCKHKRDNLRTTTLHPTTRWLARRWVAQGRLILPANATVEGIPYAWRPSGLPYWNPVQEVTANLMAIRGGIANYEDVYLESNDGDWFENITRLAEQQKHIRDSHVILDESLAPVMAGLLIGQQQQQADPNNPLAQLPVGTTT